MLQCWATFSNGLVHRSVRMIRAKNYDSVSKFVKVMPRILWLLFFPTRCIFTHDRTVALRVKSLHLRFNRKTIYVFLSTAKLGELTMHASLNTVISTMTDNRK